MPDRTDFAPLTAALAVVAAVLLGGAFHPGEQLFVGVLVTAVWIVAAATWTASIPRDQWVLLLIPVWGALSAVRVGAAPLASKETVTSWVIAWALWSLARRTGPRGTRAVTVLLGMGSLVLAIAVGAAAISNASVRVGGLFDNPNVAAAALVVMLPAGMMLERPALRSAWLLFIASALLLTGSRAGLLAAVVAAGVMLPRGRVRGLGVTVGAILGLAALMWRFISQPDLLAWHRVSIWRAALEVWSNRPWTGIGPGCLVEAAGPERILHADQVGRYQFVISFSESTPLAVLVQLGVVGFALALVGSVVWLAAARRAGVLGSVVVRASLVAVLVFSLFHDVLTLPVVLWWWAVALGCLEASASIPVSAPTETSSWGVRWAVGLALVWLTAWGVVAPATARRQAVTARGTTEDVERIQRIEPWYAEPAAARVRLLLEGASAWSWEEAAEALHWATTATNVHPGLARRWADLARVRIRVLTDLGGTAHDIAAARHALERASALDPHLPWYWLERARLERVLGRFDDAIAYARRALEEEPNTVRGWLTLSRLELECGRTAAARAALDEAVTRAGLIDRPGLTDYERELLTAPMGVIHSLRTELGATTGNGEP